MILRWNNGTENCGASYFIENLSTGEKTIIQDQAALDFINKKTLHKFRDTIHMYNAHVQLFELLGIKPTITFREILQEKKLSGYRLAKLTGIPQPTISDWATGNKNILKAEFTNIIKLCKTLDITPQELFNKLTRSSE
jgi:DNA-binding Xre family transcriptional regulator